MVSRGGILRKKAGGRSISIYNGFAKAGARGRIKGWRQIERSIFHNIRIRSKKCLFQHGNVPLYTDPPLHAHPLIPFTALP